MASRCFKNFHSGVRWKASPRITRYLSTASHRRSSVRPALYFAAATFSAGLCAVYYFDARSAIHRHVLTPLIRHTMDAETGHKFAVQVLRSGLGPRDPLPDDKRLKLELWGHEVSNPVGLAAGFDKDGEAIDGLLNLGFGWVEIGSVTPKLQLGNPRPRIFHLPHDSALINRCGFPSQGHDAVLSRVKSRIPSFLGSTESTAAMRPGALLAVNLGKNKISPPESTDDFVAGVKAFGPYSDVLVVNVSSPNTPGLRGLQNRELLEQLLSDVTKARDQIPPSASIFSRKPKLVLKIAPDLTESALIDIADAVSGSAIDGVIVSNTTIQRPSDLTDPHKTEAGGLSGPPLKRYSLAALRILCPRLPPSITLIGCGGITCGADVLEYGNAGASLVQINTSFGYDGVGACRRIKDELAAALKKEGKTWQQVVDSARSTGTTTDVQENLDMSISTLIKEAQDLKKLLDAHGEKIDERVVPVV